MELLVGHIYEQNLLNSLPFFSNRYVVTSEISKIAKSKRILKQGNALEMYALFKG